MGLFSLRENYSFFRYAIKQIRFGKNATLLDCVEDLCYEEIVWRQLGLAFFGAVTLVAAPFYFGRKKQ